MCVSGCVLSKLVKAKTLAENEQGEETMSSELTDLMESGFALLVFITIFRSDDSLWATSYPCITTARPVVAKWHADFKRYWLNYSGTTRVDINDGTFPKMTPSQALQCIHEIGAAMMTANPKVEIGAGSDDRRLVPTLIPQLCDVTAEFEVLPLEDDEDKAQLKNWLWRENTPWIEYRRPGNLSGEPEAVRLTRIWMPWSKRDVPGLEIDAADGCRYTIELDRDPNDQCINTVADVALKVIKSLIGNDFQQKLLTYLENKRKEQALLPRPSQ